MTLRCSPSQRAGSAQACAIAPTTNDFPVPAGPTSDSTLAPEVSTPRTAAAWSAPSSIPDSPNSSRNAAASSAVSGRCAALDGGRAQRPFGAHVLGGGVLVPARAFVGRAAIGQPQLVRQGGPAGVIGGQRHAVGRDRLAGHALDQLRHVRAGQAAEVVRQRVVDRPRQVGFGPLGLAWPARRRSRSPSPPAGRSAAPPGPARRWPAPGARSGPARP